jgi:hypothetical protein
MFFDTFQLGWKTELIGPLRAINSMREQHQRGELTDLKTLVDMTEERRATDPRDMTFALHGLVAGKYPGLGLAKPDYSTPVQLVFAAFTAALMMSGNLTWDLPEPFGTWACPERKIEHLPSWAVDWSCRSSSNLWISSPFANPFQASGGAQAKIDCSDGFRVLKTAGLHFDKIAKVLPQASFALEEVFTKWKDIALHYSIIKNTPYIHPERAFLITVLADQWCTSDGMNQMKLSMRARARMRITKHREEEDDWDSLFSPSGFDTEVVRKTLLEDSWTFCKMMRFFITEKNHYGLGMPGVRVGDDVVIVDGATVPFIERKSKPMFEDDKTK